MWPWDYQMWKSVPHNSCPIKGAGWTWTLGRLLVCKSELIVYLQCWTLAYWKGTVLSPEAKSSRWEHQTKLSTQPFKVWCMAEQGDTRSAPLTRFWRVGASQLRKVLEWVLKDAQESGKEEHVGWRGKQKTEEEKHAINNENNPVWLEPQTWGKSH